MMTQVASSAALIAKKKKNLHRFRLLIVTSFILLFVGATGYYFWDVQSKTKVDSGKSLVIPRRGPAELFVMATGAMRPYREVKISPKQTGLVKSLIVKQGEHVKAGQLIALMDDSNLLGDVEAAKGAYLAALDNQHKLEAGNRPQEVAAAKFQALKSEKAVLQAERNIARLQAQVQALQAQVNRNASFANRQNMLAKEGAVSDQNSIDAQMQAEVSKAQLDAAMRERDAAEMALQQSKEELNVAKEQQDLSASGFRKEEVAAAAHAAMQAKGNYMRSQSLLQDTRIKAPFDGIITQKYAEAGAIVTPTTAAATTSATSSSIVALASKLEMVAQVSEANIAKIRPGQEVEITATSFPNIPFHGTVTQVAPAAIVTQNVTTFEVHVDVDDPDSKLLAGMNVSAKFTVGKLDDAIIVPQVCVVSRKGQSGVFVPDAKGEPQFKRVKTGPTTGRDIVILSGIDDKDRIFEGLSREQLAKEGYGNRDNARGGAGPGSPFSPMGGGGGRGGRGGFGR